MSIRPSGWKTFVAKYESEMAQPDNSRLLDALAALSPITRTFPRSTERRSPTESGGLPDAVGFVHLTEALVSVAQHFGSQ